MGLRTKGPFVDTAAVNSAESVNAVRNLFYQGTGFAAREDTPDYGCDLMVELIVSHEAKNWRFPIQLKSIESPRLVGEGRFISLSFELSRLGYLLAHKPEVGLVVFYSIPDKKLYYDFADKIYFRLKDMHEDDLWEQQDRANIRIPIENLLDVDTVKELHGMLCRIFENFSAMYEEQAPHYALPSMHNSNGSKGRASIEQKAKECLLKYGLSLLQGGDMRVLTEMVDILTSKTLASDSKLSIIAAMVYHEAGKYIETEYFLEKGLFDNSLDEDIRLNGEWTKLKNDYLRNRINRVEFINGLHYMKAAAVGQNEYNLVMIELNISFQEISGNQIAKYAPEDYEQTFDSMAKRIEALNSTVKEKDFLHLLNCMNLSLFVQRCNERKLRFVRSAQAIHQKIPGDMIFKTVNESARLSFKMGQMVEQIAVAAAARSDQFTKAEAHSTYTDHFMMICLSGLGQFLKLPAVLDGKDGSIAQSINLNLQAYNTYLDIGYTDRAYTRLCHALEMIYISKHYNVPVSYDVDKLEAMQKGMEQDLQHASFEFQSLKIIANLPPSGLYGQ